MKPNKTRFWLIGLLLIVFGLGLAPVTYALASEPPSITAGPLIVPVGSNYNPLDGVTLADDVDTQEMLLARLEVYDKVDTSTENVGYIYYTLQDSDGNGVDLERPVFVLGPDRPLIYAPGAYVTMGESVDVLQGVLAWDLVDGNLTAEVVADPATIDTSLPGEYAISLTVTDSDGNTAEAVKYVFVDWPYEYYPVITAPNVIIALGEPFDVKEGVTAADQTDGDLTDQIQVDWTDYEIDRPGEYYAYYYVVNSLGLMGYAERRIVVVDPAASPVIFASDIYLETGWEVDLLQFASVFDLEDGEITKSITILDQNVDLTKAGEYFVTYQVADSDGHLAEITVTVWVEWARELYPNIYLDKDRIYLPVNGSFVPGEGVTADDLTDGDLTAAIKIEELYLDLATPGEYYVVYSVTNSLELTSNAWQQIYVLESDLPVLKVNDFSVGLNEELNIWMADLEAYDLTDGDLREMVTWDISAVDVTTAGTYPVTFRVSDSDGNTAEAVAQITVLDYSYPQIWVGDYQVIKDSEFNPLDYVYAYDEQDGELSSQVVVVKNAVRIHRLGTYFVTYAVTDSDGHTTTKTVSVEVIPEPEYTYFITYQDELIPLNVDYAQEMLFLTSDVLIPAGSSVGLAVYDHGELAYDFWFTLIDEIQPGITYRIDLMEDGLMATPITPYLWDGAGFRTTARTAEVRFMATAGGTIHYVVGEAGTELPEIDTTGEGIPGTMGLNAIKLSGLNPRTAHTIRILMEVPEDGVSNILEIEIPKLPSGPVDKGKPENPGKPVKPGKP